MTHASTATTVPARVAMRVTLQLEISVNEAGGPTTILSAIDAALDSGELQEAIMDGGLDEALRIDSVVVESAALVPPTPVFYVEMTTRATGAIGIQSAIHAFEVTGSSTSTEAVHACTDWLTMRGDRENATIHFVYDGTRAEAQRDIGTRAWPTCHGLHAPEVAEQKRGGA